MQYTRKRCDTNSTSNTKADIVVEDLLRWTSKWTVNVKPNHKHGQKYKVSEEYSLIYGKGNVLTAFYFPSKKPEFLKIFERCHFFKNL